MYVVRYFFRLGFLVSLFLYVIIYIFSSLLV